ncbi:ABC transporter ATP-binding protein arb1 [Entomortierella chlamydospora]|uniref:ABC transporter ATP-binding protein arb1 n=1 Tax=Entomortierella chlamydospora TaxID=101097 RepID=A0A9P6T2R7_9FUNG|nr:ABC transporter ATP-binding protein arb1 [Entomortierella chlamydospora]KAG0020705.1 ABC transporter ATP-binding protein arb1 [Entomortierella chlamydospora]
MSALSASKQKRLAAKAAKEAAKKSSSASSPATTNGRNTPALSEGAPEADDADALIPGLNAMDVAKQKSNDRNSTGVLTSQPLSRDIKIESFSLSFHGRELISNTDIDFNFGRRYGLIGANGSGKSTFLECLAAREVPIPEHIDIYLLQEEAAPSDHNAIEAVVIEAKHEVERLEKQVEDMLAEVDGAENPLLDDVYDRIEQLDPSTFETRAATLLHGLGFSKKDMLKATKDMSGGWRMRVALAKALFVKPTLLLLDEPTNHLDLEACVWLEDYLSKYDRILVLISHSQDFLNGVCTNIMNLNHKRKLVYYGGNYDTYVKTRAELEVNQMKAYYKQQDEIAHIKKFIASAGTYSNLVRQAKSKQKIIDKMEAAGLVEKVDPPALFKFKFSDTDKLPPPVLAFDEVGFAYSGNMKDALYRGVNLGIDMDSRVALVGPNGAGKSTLLKLMTGELTATEGRIQRHMQLKLGKYNQHSADQLDMELSPIDYLRKRFPDMPQDIDHWRQQIGRYGLTGSHQTSPIGHLSHGLQTRLVFAELALSRPHMLLLDEPTNHLDMESIDSLADAIKNFSGGVVLVSHDFRLLKEVADQIIVVDKGVSVFDGTILEYKKILQKKSRESNLA